MALGPNLGDGSSDSLSGTGASVDEDDEDMEEENQDRGESKLVKNSKEFTALKKH